MTLRALVVAAVLSFAGSAAAAAPAAVDVDARMQRLERWLQAVFHHNPGRIDDEIVAIGTWTNSELQLLYVDASTVVQVIRKPSYASQAVGLSTMIASDRTGQTPRPARYTPTENSRLKQIACAVGGFADSASCEWARALIASDVVLSRLSIAGAAVRQDSNANFIVRRAALMHSDVVMFGLAAPQAPDFTAGQQSVRMSISDGQQTSLTQPDLHWEFARKLLGLVAAPGSDKPSPGGDAMVRSWYVATSAWMQRDGHHDNIHVDRGREIFPDDADLAMLTGAQHESYAAPAIQTAVRSAVLPTGTRLSVESERAEIRDAEKFLRRATELKPDFAEAHIRLGHVLALMGRDTEAAEQLKRGLDTTENKLLQYYGLLFAADVEEKLGHDEASRTAYERAATLYPRAQSPRLGLSELARHAGHRDEALHQMEAVYAIESEGRDDEPWWTYNYQQGRNADVLLDEVQRPFRLTHEQ